MKNAVFNWSGGKDSALALHKILLQKEYNIISLLTTIDEETQTSSIHSIPLKLLEKQAQSIGIPIYPVVLSKNKITFEQGMLEAVNHFKKLGVNDFIFGDIFLADVKSYRENKLNPLGINVIEPLWNKTSQEIINEFLQSGIKAKIIVTQADKLNETYIGKNLTKNLIQALPAEIDPCGENGEYHTFTYHGGPFKTKVNFEINGAAPVTYDFKMDDGTTKSFKYWQAKISF
ncbi:MAG: diphthine--ammonia ligase [Bacteroidetes bacterium]|jgi:uncharacterized protein (TIGR00290 family)|nr:diphthine--ammonia ligase [Bacteroidota bacterium]